MQQDRTRKVVLIAILFFFVGCKKNEVTLTYGPTMGQRDQTTIDLSQCDQSVDGLCIRKSFFHNEEGLYCEGKVYEVRPKQLLIDCFFDAAKVQVAVDCETQKTGYLFFGPGGQNINIDVVCS